MCVCKGGGEVVESTPPPIYTHGTSVTSFCFFTCHFYTGLSENNENNTKITKIDKKIYNIKHFYNSSRDIAMLSQILPRICIIFIKYKEIFFEMSIICFTLMSRDHENIFNIFSEGFNKNL